MMRNLDAAVGKVMLTSKAAGIERNTLVIFTSDNGGERFSYNWPLTGQKFDLHEGGIRVPAIVRWPSVARAGIATDQAVITMDWTATMVAATEGKANSDYPLDGIDLRGMLSGKQGLLNRKFFWRTKRQGSMRSGKWKYLQDGNNEFLFDLSVDEREQADFKSTQTNVFRQLRDEFDAWEKEMVGYPGN